MGGFLQYLFEGSEVVGTIAFAASGAMVAIDRGLDLFGVIFLGVITACGGGILRDIILGTFPPNAFSNPVFVFVSAITSVLVFMFAYLKGARYQKGRQRIDHDMNFVDAVGLGIFSVIGAQVAMRKGYADNAFLCIMMGMSTGVGGGILRDLLSRQIPAVLYKRIYAVASIVGAAVYYGMMNISIAEPISMLGGMVITVIVRMLATHYLWDLPIVHQ